MGVCSTRNGTWGAILHIGVENSWKMFTVFMFCKFSATVLDKMHSLSTPSISHEQNCTQVNKKFLPYSHCSLTCLPCKNKVSFQNMHYNRAAV